MKQFGFESACRKKYNKNPYLRMQFGYEGFVGPIMQSKKVSFEDYVKSGMCNNILPVQEQPEWLDDVVIYS